jgi:hypothetical protein
MSRNFFDKELEELHIDMIKMGSLVKSQLTTL